MHLLPHCIMMYFFPTHHNSPQFSFQFVPRNLSPEIQSLVLDDNPLGDLGKDEFKTSGLLNLQTLQVRRCGLVSVDEHSFRWEVIIFIEAFFSPIDVGNFETGTDAPVALCFRKLLSDFHMPPNFKNSVFAWNWGTYLSLRSVVHIQTSSRCTLPSILFVNSFVWHITGYFVALKSNHPRDSWSCFPYPPLRGLARVI